MSYTGCNAVGPWGPWGGDTGQEGSSISVTLKLFCTPVNRLPASPLLIGLYRSLLVSFWLLRLTCLWKLHLLQNKDPWADKLKWFAYQNEDTLEEGVATWGSWPRLELLEGQPASMRASMKDPPSALVAVCDNKSPDHDQNQPPTSACTCEVCLEKRGGLVFCPPIQLEEQWSNWTLPSTGGEAMQCGREPCPCVNAALAGFKERKINYKMLLVDNAQNYFRWCVWYLQGTFRHVHWYPWTYFVHQIWLFITWIIIISSYPRHTQFPQTCANYLAYATQKFKSMFLYWIISLPHVIP